MIQRKQTLFLLLSALLGLILLFVPNNSIITAAGPTDIFLIPLQAPFISTTTHYFTIAINFISLLVAFITIFMYGRRMLQIRLCYVLMISWLIVGLMLFFGAFVVMNEEITSVQKNYTALIVAVAGIIVNYFAARYIKKDIELLKSADRIR